MSKLFWLADAQMAGLAPVLPKSHGKPRVDGGRVLSGMIFINRNGLRWCDAPTEYGLPKHFTIVGSGGLTRASSPGGWMTWPPRQPFQRW